MIVVDTNVLSEPLRPAPDPAVLAWLTAHSEELLITAISVGELEYGVQRLPEGQRRDRLQSAVGALTAGAGDRVLPFDEAAARQYGIARSRRESAGKSASVEDTMIAGICLAGGHELATRNGKDFSDLGLIVHDPWMARP